jgi:hypothetical protein
MIDVKHCNGCRNNFYNGNNIYNGNNNMGIEECWSLRRAKMVTLYEIHNQTMPGTPGAFKRRTLPHCFHADDFAYYRQGELPKCAIAIRT